MLKTAGIIIIFTVFVYLGCEASRAASLRLQYAETLCRLCQRLSDGIGYNRVSAAEITADFDYDGQGMAEDEFRRRLSVLSPELHGLFGELTKKLTVCMGGEAVGLCGYYSRRFAVLRDELAAETPKKRRLYATLGVTAAVAAAVILV